ncbi:MAG: DUF5789 family protein [Thermoplasmatota archaeon]
MPPATASQPASGVQSEIRKALREAQFPISKGELLERYGNLPLHLSPAGPVTLHDILNGIPEVTLFANAQHVAEVVAINWRDLADVFRPGGGA